MFELSLCTEDELAMIESWYLAAAGESASGSSSSKIENDRLRALLSKLGFDPHSMDQHEFDHES